MTDAWQAAVRKGLVDELLRPARLARDVERGVLGQILGRSDWPVLRYPMLAAWTDQWSRAGDESPHDLPIVHARLAHHTTHTTRVDIHPVLLRPAATPAPQPVAHARRPAAATPPATTRPAPAPATPATPATQQPPAAAAPTTPTTPTDPPIVQRAPQATPRAELPRVVAAFRRDLSEGPAHAPLTHPAPPASPSAREVSVTIAAPPIPITPEPRPTDRAPSDQARAPAMLAPPHRDALVVEAVRPAPPADPDLVHAAPTTHAQPTSPVAPTASRSAQPRVTDLPHAAPRPAVPDTTAPVAARPVRVAPHDLAVDDLPPLVHTTAPQPAPTTITEDAPLAPHASPRSSSARPHTPGEPVATRPAPAPAPVRRDAPRPAIKAQWVATPGDAPRPHARARPALDLPHLPVAAVAPSTPTASRPVPSASPPHAPTPTTTTTTTTPTPTPPPPIDLDAVVDTALRRLGRELGRAHDLRRAIR